LVVVSPSISFFNPHSPRTRRRKIRVKVGKIDSPLVGLVSALYEIEV
jgi:hypothetical protein